MNLADTRNRNDLKKVTAGGVTSLESIVELDGLMNYLASPSNGLGHFCTDVTKKNLETISLPL